MTPSEQQPLLSLEERKFEQDAAAKKRELDLKEREIAAKEKEVAAKEVELQRSRWLNPTVIGILAASLGLAGSLAVARINNANTQQVERQRSQSTLILEGIKTGNPDAACKNLVFLVGLGLLDDITKNIQSNCADAPKGAPSLPFESNQIPILNVALVGFVIDADTTAGIEGAMVQSKLEQLTSSGRERVATDASGMFIIAFPALMVSHHGATTHLKVEKAGYVAFEGNVALDYAGRMLKDKILLHKRRPSK